MSAFYFCVLLASQVDGAALLGGCSKRGGTAHSHQGVYPAIRPIHDGGSVQRWQSRGQRMPHPNMETAVPVWCFSEVRPDIQKRVLILCSCHFSSRCILIFPTANMVVGKCCPSGIIFSIGVISEYVWKAPENGFPPVSKIKELANIFKCFKGSAEAAGWRREW